MSIIENSGYECEEPQARSTGDGEDGTDVACGDLVASYFEDASAEAETYESLSDLWGSVPAVLPVTQYVIRGDTWRIYGPEAPVKKVAESLDKDVVTMGN